jgi:hypothetical protein
MSTKARREAQEVAVEAEVEEEAEVAEVVTAKQPPLKEAEDKTACSRRECPRRTSPPYERYEPHWFYSKRAA